MNSNPVLSKSRFLASMEYYISLTYRCNLSCSYCAARRVVFDSNCDFKDIDVVVLDKILHYIMVDSARREGQSYIVFYGGEPTLVPNIVRYVMDKTANSNLKYVLYTNGLLINEFPKDLLALVDVVFMSIDGDKKTHDAFKFSGSFDKVLANAKLLRDFTGATLIGRITLQEESDLFESVTNVRANFDYVFWQIVNKERFVDSESMISRYRLSLSRLYDVWCDNISCGNFVKIVPFMSINSFDIHDESLSFRCGMGYGQIIFDIHGKAYECDEYIGEDRVCGSVNDFGSIHLVNRFNHDIFADCKECKISKICRGRCRHALETFPKDTILTYCSLTKILVDVAFPVDIRHLMNDHDADVIKITEQIP